MESLSVMTTTRLLKMKWKMDYMMKSSECMRKCNHLRKRYLNRMGKNVCPKRTAKLKMRMEHNVMLVRVYKELLEDVDKHFP